MMVERAALTQVGQMQNAANQTETPNAVAARVKALTVSSLAQITSVMFRGPITLSAQAGFFLDRNSSYRERRNKSSELSVAAMTTHIFLAQGGPGSLLLLLLCQEREREGERPLADRKPASKGGKKARDACWRERKMQIAAAVFFSSRGSSRFLAPRS